MTYGQDLLSLIEWKARDGFSKVLSKEVIFVTLTKQKRLMATTSPSELEETQPKWSIESRLVYQVTHSHTTEMDK
jgi:hypothetical protein